MSSHEISFRINGLKEIRSVPGHMTLLKFLREELSLSGTKSGCDTGECGACTVLLNGEPVNACMILAAEIDGADILTVEGLMVDAQLDPIQEAMIDISGTQCGFCTPGVLISARALLDRDPRPDVTTIKDALRGNLCRCTGYTRIVESIQIAAGKGA
jgi:carbon-monoxide dehydrogenase small subunit